jgi:NADH oxidase (H2O-forming)
MNTSNILQVSEDVSWIGVLDHEIVTFDIVMETKYGTTYNSYFIDADKPTIIETVKEKYWPEFRDKLLALIEPSKIEYIVCNHTEPDHSGSLKHLLKLAPEATVVGSGQALTYLREMVDHPFKSLKVRDGDIIDLGNKKLRVIGAPNLHWPDTIYTYLEEEGLLFTCDSFGAHFADERMFDDLLGNYGDAFDYYFDVILKPYSKFMLKAIEKIKTLPLDMICPGHGPILRSGWKDKIERSQKLANIYLEETRKNNRVLIAYVSAYGYTGEMAKQIAEGLKKTENITVDLLDIENILLGDLEQHIATADAIIVGSPTINQNTLLPIYKLFSVINPIRDKGKPAAAFGSFGWSGEAVKLIEDHLRNLKMNIIGEGQTARFLPNSQEAERLISFGKEFIQALQEES